MHSKRNIGWLVPLMSAVLVMAASCGKDATDLFPDAGGNDDAGQPIDSGVPDNHGGNDGTVTDSPADVAPDTSDGAPCPIHCSDDLHQILDCNDKVVQSCPSDKGCDPGGTCVAACDSAVANKTSVGC